MAALSDPTPRVSTFEQVLDENSAEFAAYCRQIIREACEQEIIDLERLLPQGRVIRYWKVLNETRRRSFVDATVNRFKFNNFNLDKHCISTMVHSALIATVRQSIRPKAVTKEDKKQGKRENPLLRKALFNQQSHISRFH